MPGLLHAKHGLHGHGKPGDMAHAAFYLTALKRQLRAIGHMLAGAAAALAGIGTGRRYALGRGGENIHRTGKSIALFHTGDLRDDASILAQKKRRVQIIWIKI